MPPESARPRLPVTAFAVLGLVGMRAMSGYELAAFAGRSIGHLWPIAKSQVYGELSRLEAAGLVSGTDVAQERLPDKRVFALTEAGRARLHDWLSLDADEPDRFRSAFLVKVFFAGSREPDQARALITAYRGRMGGVRDHLAGINAHLEAIPQTSFCAGLTALYGLRHTEAAIAWCDEALDRLDSTTG